MHYLYIIRCEDGYLYIGITDNVSKRLNQHRIGFCRNTKNRGRINLVHIEQFCARSDAAKREKEIKGWRREKKDNLIQNNTNKCLL